MPLVKKIAISISGNPLPTSVYDIGAESDNISYDDNVNIKDKIDSKQETLIFDTIPTEDSENPVTSDGIATAINQLQTNFQAGVDSVYNACVDKGSTPASHALADILQAIKNISGGGGLSPVLHNNFVFRPQRDTDVALPANTGKYYVYLLGNSYASSYTAELDTEITNASKSVLFEAMTPEEMAPSYRIKTWLVTKTDPTLVSEPDNSGEDYSGFIALSGEPTFGEFVINANVSSSEQTQTVEFTEPYLFIVVGIRTDNSVEFGYDTYRILESDQYAEFCGQMCYQNIDRDFLFAQVFAIHNDGSNQAIFRLASSVESGELERLVLAYAPMTITET